MEVIELFRLQVNRFDSGFTFTDKIRSGSQGCVVALFCENGEKIASKIIDYSNRTNVDKAIIDFEREYRSLELLSHPSIVKFLKFEHHRAKQQAFLQMEWAGSELAETPGGAVDLADIIGHRQMRDGQPTLDYLPESFIWHVLFHLGAALALCHHGIDLHRKTAPEEVDSRAVLSHLFGQSSDRLRSLAIKHPKITWNTERITFSARESHEPIIHRDIKPRNVLLSDPPREPSTQTWRSNGDISLKDATVLRIYPVVLLGDFGFSAPLRDAQTRGVGTIGYAAPEIPLEPNRPGSRPLEWKTSCDIFSLGATIRHLMTLQSPPEYAVDSTAWPPFPSAYSEQLRHLVSQCHHSDPSQRPTAIDVLDACIRQHRWDQSFIGPYGIPISADFTATMTRSWRECVRAMAQVENFDPPRDMQLRRAEGFGFQIVDVLTLDRQTEASSLAMLIAGAYHYQLFHPKTKYSLPPRNSQFVNRPHLLQSLRRRLDEETTDQITIMIHGPGRVGKSQIALDLAHQLKDANSELSIFWVDGDNSSAFQESYRQLAIACGIPTGPSGDVGFLGRVRQWLESRIARRWLMVIDNVNDVHSFYGDEEGGDTRPGLYIPCCAHGSLLFTTRDPSLQTKIQPRPFVLQVPPLTREEAKDHLLRIISHTRLTQGRVASIAALPAGELPAEITEGLGHLPLAITLNWAEEIRENIMSMRVIIMCTLLLIPGTFAASVFSISILTFDHNSGEFSLVMGAWEVPLTTLWLFLALSSPLLALVLATWFFAYGAKSTRSLKGNGLRGESLLTGDGSKSFVKSSEEGGAIMQRLMEEMRENATSMRVIAICTLLLIPGTFVASFFHSSVLTLGDHSRGEFSTMGGRKILWAALQLHDSWSYLLVALLLPACAFIYSARLKGTSSKGSGLY